MFLARRAVTAIALFFFSLSCQAAVVFHELAFLGGTQWTAAFTVKSTGTPGGLGNFSIYFDQAYASNLQLLGNPVKWDTIVVQADAALGSDGFLDALVFDSADALASGESISGFTVSFDWSSTLVPPVAFDFVVSDTNFQPIETGVSVAAPQVQQDVPAPATLPLAAIALALLARVRASDRSRVGSNKPRFLAAAR